MIYFFQKSSEHIIAVGTEKTITSNAENVLQWLFSGAFLIKNNSVSGSFVGPRKEMVTPWSTNAVEITQNCGVNGIFRIEEFFSNSKEISFDPMLQQYYKNLDQDLFTLNHKPAEIINVIDIDAYNQQEGLALNNEEIQFLNQVVSEIGRPLTDAEIFGFSQINSEHCRHKIFNGQFIIDGVQQELSLFQWIKKTAKENPNFIVSAYKDNVAFIQGPKVEQFAPVTQDKPDFFQTSDFDSVISLKAETHNFPTTVEPFNGAATGAGGEIRDRLAGGQGSFPLAGTAVYMTSYSRTDDDRKWENAIAERKWLYQSPVDILIKASNGASDFGNKYGQPLICGSLLTFEHEENGETYGFDKVIMLAGGIGFAKLKNAKKLPVTPGNQIVVLGGDNYRIGMGGGAVSSVATGEFANAIELNAVQRSNPEMQKRVANAIRAMAELDENPIISIHDHGAGGHLNCLSELVEDTGGKIAIDQLPIGDPTLSDKEILSNESQERMGLVIHASHAKYLNDVAKRERAPIYQVGETSDDAKLVFTNKKGEKPFNLKLNHLFGSSPVTILQDNQDTELFEDVDTRLQEIEKYIKEIVQLEAVASKDWLTNKVDRSVSGKVATQQTVGEIQLPLNNLGVMALDFKSNLGVATSIGHAPVAAMANAAAGSRLAVAEALTNLVFAPLTHGIKGVSLSANWMWPAKNQGENKRLYEAVKAISEFAIDLGINIPTGKDSLSMTQKYPDGKKVKSPGTVIVSAVAEVSDIRKTISPVIKHQFENSKMFFVDFGVNGFELSGSSFGQINNRIGQKTPDAEAGKIKRQFESIQKLIKSDKIIAGHDIGSGGLIVTLLEMNFPNSKNGVEIDLSAFNEPDLVKLLFSENPGVVLQIDSKISSKELAESGLVFIEIGHLINDHQLTIKTEKGILLNLSIDSYRDHWMKSSHLLDARQTKPEIAKARFTNYKVQPLRYKFSENFTGKNRDYLIDLNRKTKSGIRAAIIREKGVNGDREMAYALWMAGFDVKDVHMTDLISGRENLSNVNMIVFVGGFSNSDVLGSAKGWAGSFLFNPTAKATLDAFYERNDTLSLGVCNGCQVMMELEKVFPHLPVHPKMKHNISGKFESAFINVDILPNDTVMFGSLAGSRLGIWMAHGEGKFEFSEDESKYKIPVKFSYSDFPGNPNGSDFSAAAVASLDGRHVAIMPHLERSIFPWNWAHYENKLLHEVSPWIEPFINAKNWIKEII